MNKKAIGHQIDWIISTAIFLLYILSIFAFVKPGIKATHQPETLLKIIQDNFDTETKWSVSTVPIFINPLCTIGKNGGIIISFPFVSWDKEQILIKNSNDDSSSFTITEDNKIQLKKTTENYQMCYTPGYKQIITQQSCDSVGDCQDCINYGKYGVTENLEGISIDKIKRQPIEGLSPGLMYQDYNGLKTKWGFPESKEFIITVSSGERIGYVDEPPTNIPVYVRQYQVWLLDANCKREQVTINIRVW